LPDSRGKGLGKLVTKEFLDYMFGHNILNAIHAKTFVSNERNQHINALMGFKEYGRDEKYVYMKLNREDYHG
jgi:RimJ/RimL family protein N-acetyltransferase